VIVAFVVLLCVILCPRSEASLPSTLMVKCELELKGGEKVEAWLPYYTDGECRFLEAEGVYEIEPEGGERVKLTERYVFDNLLPLLWGDEGRERAYRRLFRLHYLPERADRAAYEQEVRISFAGVLAAEEVWLPWSKDGIDRVRVLECVELNIAPVVVLDRQELALLKKPALAFFSVEQYPEGNVSLMSYNPRYDTPAKLESLLRRFVEGKPPVGDAEWWSPIYKAKYDFVDEYLPQDIVLLIYSVTD
jgi:hypothetical protein